MNKHFEEPTELQYLAERQGEIYDEIILMDEHGDVLTDDQERGKMAIRSAMEELWSQFYGIRDYMAFCHPMDLNDCLILAGQIRLCAESLQDKCVDPGDERRDKERLERMCDQLVSCLQTELGVALHSLGLKTIIPDNIDKNKKAVRIVHEIRAKQYDLAKAAGIVDMVKAGEKLDQKEAASGRAAKPKGKPAASQRAKPDGTSSE